MKPFFSYIFLLFLLLLPFQSRTQNLSFIDSFPGPAQRMAASGSFYDGKSRFLFGSDSLGGYSHEFHEYNHVTSSWVRKNDILFPWRSGAVAVHCNGKLYTGIGCDETTLPNWTYYHDFWKYDEGTDTWTQKADFPGGGREYPVCEVVGNKIYITLGDSLDPVHGYTMNHRDVWEYETALDSWTRRSDLPVAGLRVNFVSWELNGSLYMPIQGTGPASVLWTYDTQLDVWTMIGSLDTTVVDGNNCFSGMVQGRAILFSCSPANWHNVTVYEQDLQTGSFIYLDTLTLPGSPMVVNSDTASVYFLIDHNFFSTVYRGGLYAYRVPLPNSVESSLPEPENPEVSIHQDPSGSLSINNPYPHPVVLECCDLSGRLLLRLEILPGEEMIGEGIVQLKGYVLFSVISKGKTVQTGRIILI